MHSPDPGVNERLTLADLPLVTAPPDVAGGNGYAAPDEPMLPAVEVAELEPTIVAQAEAITDDESWLKQRLRDPRTIISFLLALAILVSLFTQLKIDPSAIWATIQ